MIRLIYSDEILANGKDPSAILSRLNKNFTWKEDKYFPVKERSVGPPDQYLGAETRIPIESLSRRVCLFYVYMECSQQKP
jgi:hypothetical protein